MTKFRFRLAELRAEEGVPLKDLAAAIGYSVTCCSYWEIGKTVPSIEAAVKVAQHYNVSLDYLAGLTDERRPPV